MVLAIFRRPMFLAIFHQKERQVFVGRRGKKSPYGHTFGGSADYSGLSAFRRQPLVHLLLRFNTADPAVGVQLPSVHWLPLLCAIRYGACDLGYRVMSDDAVKILYQEETKAWKGFPYAGFPKKLPAERIALAETPYDPGDPQTALFFAGIFGYDGLTKKQYSRLLRYVVDEGIYDPDLSEWATPEQYLREGNCWPFVQGPPDDGCPDPVCRNHDRRRSLRTLAIFREADKVEEDLWGPHCENLQIIYQICPKCQAIRTTNQCT